MRVLILSACVLWVAGCNSSPTGSSKPSEGAQTSAPVKPADETRRFPQTNLVSTEVVNSALLGKAFMPGGTLAHYKKGNTEYRMFVARAASPTDAAVALSEWRTALAHPEFVASFGGYFGQDAGEPLFVFTKNEWIAGVAGLPRAEADAAARVLASRL
jgi:hypothetical protein